MGANRVDGLSGAFTRNCMAYQAKDRRLVRRRRPNDILPETGQCGMNRGVSRPHGNPGVDVDGDRQRTAEKNRVAIELMTVTPLPTFLLLEDA